MGGLHDYEEPCREVLTPVKATSWEKGKNMKIQVNRAGETDIHNICNNV